MCQHQQHCQPKRISVCTVCVSIRERARSKRLDRGQFSGHEVFISFSGLLGHVEKRDLNLSQTEQPCSSFFFKSIFLFLFWFILYSGTWIFAQTQIEQPWTSFPELCKTQGTWLYFKAKLLKLVHIWRTCSSFALILYLGKQHLFCW